jgi:2-isopropylmalate synthase
MVDIITESARGGRIVFWEEVARDGAQAKTLITADVRVRLAREHGRIFGADGPRHLVFAAGFPAVCREEFEAVRRVALEAEGVASIAAVCRGTAADVRQAVAAVRGSYGSRVMVVVPASDEMAQVMTHGPAERALGEAEALLDEARSVDDRVAVDVCLADASRTHTTRLAAHASALTRAGAGVILLADTVGDQLPAGAARMFSAVRAASDDAVVLGCHLHNDLGLGLANTLEAAAAGVRVLSSSWLGLAERSGLVATEQLLFLLAYRPDRTTAILGEGAMPWWTKPDLHRIPQLAALVSEATGIPLTVTTPIVGGGVGSISTGTPFVEPQLFQPFDPDRLLGIAPRVVLTHLASTRVVRAVAAGLGHELDRERAADALAWVKSTAYDCSKAMVDEASFLAYLEAAGR